VPSVHDVFRRNHSARSSHFRLASAIGRCRWNAHAFVPAGDRQKSGWASRDATGRDRFRPFDGALPVGVGKPMELTERLEVVVDFR
jgi:hypothetical protein